MDRPTAASDSFDPEAATRISLSLASQPASWHFASGPIVGETERLATVWTGLCTGQVRIVRHLQEESRTVLQLEERRAYESSAWAIRGRPLTILQRVLSGQSLNFISLELSLSSSTVSGEFQNAMRALELKPRLSGLPLYLAQLWHASQTCALGDARAPSNFQAIRNATVSLPRPDLQLATVLTRAELEVSAMLLQGRTHAEIASARGTSVRTIANQLASIFSKLKVSGRLELLTALAHGRLLSKPQNTRRATRHLLD